MYWWNYRKLALALRADKVKPWQLLVYWVSFIMSLLSLPAMYMFATPPTDTSLALINGYVLPLLFLATSITMTYRLNKSGDSRDYLKRFVCLNFPLDCRYILIFFLPMSIFGALKSVALMVLACPTMDDEKLLDACIAKWGETFVVPSPTLIETVFYFFSLMVSLYWYRRAFLFVSGQKQ